MFLLNLVLSILSASLIMQFGLSRVEANDQGGATRSADELSTFRVSDTGMEYWVEQVAEELTFPSSIAWLPTGEMLISERFGRGLKILRNEGSIEEIKGVPEHYEGVSDGIKDVLVDPHFAANKTIYLYLSEGSFKARHAAVYSARYDDAALSDVRRIFKSKDSVGGAIVTLTARMIALEDGTLLIAVAEDHSSPRAQSLDSHMGKVLRINRDGSIPSDNPFLHVRGALPEIWSIGHRVPLGLHEDLDSGLIWEVEPGPRGGDELNILKRGANYGWARASWGFAYANNGLEAPVQSASDIEDPIHVWMPSLTPSAITRCQSLRFPSWKGDYLMGSLSGKALLRLRIKDRRVILQEHMLQDLNERIRDVKMGPDSMVYLVTDSRRGRVMRLLPGRPRKHQHIRIAQRIVHSGANNPQALIDTDEEQFLDLSPEELERGRQIFLEKCSGCHALGKLFGEGRPGPDLDGIYGKLMGRRNGFDYSPNMAGGVIQWNFRTLDTFLANPEDLVPGTKMVVAPLNEAATRRAVIGFLATAPRISVAR